ncbi:hypothetical protein Patl1_25739 [Pistacia atlantica]|uniref:Uncharacterized protein n=1 Tax=Pistacia atlantica TaxID=434234 RepID=A0ACC1B2A2_9ROSI|nr:hypothetical protein Patl1_25739 [Pistacia atlantica]
MRDLINTLTFQFSLCLDYF